MTPTTATAPLSRPLLLSAAAVGGILAPLNSTMLAVALPELRSDFAVDHSAIGVLVSSYLIAMAVAQPLGGRLGDQLGRALLFRWGLAIFLVLSVAGALSTSFAMLVVLRIGQALVGAAIIPNGLAMLRESLPPDRLGRSMGLVAAVASMAAAAGPLIGAALLAVGPWRLLFLVNVPLAIVGLVCISALRYPERPRRERAALDWFGALTFGAILAVVTFTVSSIRADSSVVAPIVGGVVLAVLLTLFVRGQRTTSVPVVEWRLFRRRSFVSSTSYVMFSNLVMYTTLLAIPFFLVEVQGRDSGTSGALIGTMSVLLAVAAPFGGRVSDRLGRRTPALVGSVVVVIASGMLAAGVTPEVSVEFLTATLVLLGLGIGFGFGPATAAATESATPAEAGSAAGANSMMRYLGSILGAGILGAVLTDAGAAPDPGLFRDLFLVMLGVSLLASLSAFFIDRELHAETESGAVDPVSASTSLGTAGGDR